MGVVTTEGVAIAELVVYIPVALCAIFVVVRHGFHRQLGWIYLVIFSGIRVGGSVMEILSTKNPNNANDKEWATILQSVGLSPLLLSTLGLLKRIIDETSERAPSDPTSGGNLALQGFAASSGIVGKLVSIYTNKATATSRRSKIIQLIQIPALIALILAISGGTDQASSNVSDQKSGKTETRAAIILFLVIYLAACFFWVITVRDLGRMVSSQRRLFLGVLLALPFIAVRLLYSLIVDFANNPKFSFVDGDPTIQLGMATIEEFIVVVMYTILGLMSPRSTIDPAVGGGVVSQNTYGLASGAVYPRAADASSSPYDDVSYAHAGAQHAYNAAKGY
ncbi:hypothetical protein N7448_002978 [Penicillium atrosanguineum]|uniref:DUF7702 domain-containing protein n=1 Tax=Penicillium atrosanguineum TaxID=1132637 RepID=A0A9W9PWM0_9EURO|nr:hypothetical protein N7526_008784 [Penicillium atrosanguineum]KAJ5139570.1 hypothetical protein N7448_002978 [Penicillium atrosanguineum]KAJ5315013.1 hypothetical protein N7476_005320 [Penicillium atrosanguineum]